MPPKAEIINGKKTFTILENNPKVFNALSAKLGLSPDLEWYDVYSLTEPSLLSLIPRPVLALLVIMPLTPAWNANRVAEDKDKPLVYPGKGSQEPVLWFQQTIGEACGSIGLIHCLLNGPAKSHIVDGGWLARIKDEAVDLGMDERAKLLYDSQELEDAHQSVAEIGDSKMPSMDGEGHTGQHFVAFVKEGGKLWELEGSRRGPLERGSLGEDEDLLCPRAIELGIGRVIELERASGGGDLRFSCIALAKKFEE
ncbi:ubiquitin carboxyl-terminal hydrolase L3 [Blastomyces parvus]|uniref:Ubiquitin carboxyl-terminal hydrolase n=1 Tax=Blastomyces parvus TaxID=2060905 RepID=A0A2B7X8P3_9EURO|nr:ubiquitin carboxyl-terminal hydrolase L3 [Blastomyces parvus]